TSTKKYFSIILFNMDAKKYLKSDLFLSTVPSFIVNFLVLLLIVNIKIAFTLALFTLLCRIIGESINIWFYKKYKVFMVSNLVMYWIILLLFIGITLLPIIHISISYLYVLITTIVFIPIAILSYIYLSKVKDYKLIYKKLNTLNRVMSEKTDKDYNRQSVVEVKSKDIVINSKKTKNKKGYDLFNTIFFERHKEILLRSAKNFAYAVGLITIACIVIAKLDHNSGKLINEYILTRLSWAVIIMYFINRGAILTQAMFYNCDHAMLTFNFYKEPKVILNLFKKRLITITKINLIPGLVMALGVVVVLFLTGGTTNIINYITIPIFIISLSIFFSVHYLVIYYLLQPYNKYMKVKSITYTVVIFLTYLVSYLLTRVITSALIFSIIGVLTTTIYIGIALFAVYKLAPLTFRIR
ncbi:MAG: hypothetical protein IJH34_01640, partial [Romboutsia sp.]|nr:hypothetical protein [Romboutsia sp.]